MSDTKEELRRDQWEWEHMEECGTCQFIIGRRGAHYCDNPESELNGMNVDYDDGCASYVRHSLQKG